MDGWLNLYKPRGISSYRAISIVKNYFAGHRIGHTGTLDPEAEGVLPVAIGQATKLVSILMDSKKQYSFIVQFGAQTSTGDIAGETIRTTEHIPTEAECKQICNSFTGQLYQTPPAYSAIKVNGVRAYKLARANQKFELKKRLITIYDLKLIGYDREKKRAAYLCDCSRGTYIRTLAEDISLSLHSLGFVIELRRTKVGIFTEANSVNVIPATNLRGEAFAEALEFMKSKCLRIEEVLDDIPVLEIDDSVAKKIRYGQQCEFDMNVDHNQVWLRYDGKILAIGSLLNKRFKSSRVFNYIKNGDE